jgi:hypothetical protein
MNIPKEAKECWFHSCVAHYCLCETWTQPCTYPDCKVKDYKGNPYYIHKKPKQENLIEIEMEEEI